VIIRYEYTNITRKKKERKKKKQILDSADKMSKSKLCHPNFHAQSAAKGNWAVNPGPG
jgi:hypothetical protein